jgi:phosphatidate cytidylyltransferase
VSELVKRILFAVVAIPVVLGLLYLGDAALAILLGAASGIAAWEFFRIARAAGHEPLDEVGIVLAAAFPLLAHAHQRDVFTMPLAAGMVVLLAVLAATIWMRGVAGRPLGAAAMTVFGASYTGGTLAFAYGLRYHRYAIGALAGTVLVLFPLVLTWTQDTGAYFVGRTLGRRKLIPSVSPGKTVEGSIGGLVLTVIVSWLYARMLMPAKAQLGLAPWAAIAFGVVISIAAQVGDLAESLLKREAKVKDSSALLPGHGGVLDRLDSVFFVLPVAYLLLGALLIPALR